MSPLLFDIYMEQVFAKLKQRYTENFFYKLFADDLVVVMKAENLPEFIAELDE